MKKTKVLIVDDHPLTRAGVRAILEVDSSIDIIGEAEDGIDAVKQAREKKPDIMVMDITMPQLSGTDATREILEQQPDIKIIALSIHSGQNFVKGMLDAGAVGYLLKEEVPEELLKGVENVLKGNMYLSSTITRAALEKENKSAGAIKTNILAAKLHPPPALQDYVVRSKIINQLESNVLKPLSVISAGAGYGKSVVASQWLGQTQYLNSWIALDDDHNDIRIFLSYLVAAIEKALPGMLENTKNLILSALLPPVKNISNTLINELCDIDEDIILVLDDYHIIKESKVHDLINEWLRFPPPSVHLCIITRRDPPLNIGPLQLAGRMTEVRMEDLSFTNSEISEFYNQVKHIDLPTESIEKLSNKTEGWVLGLRLFSMVMNDENEIDRILSSASGGLHSLSEYLLSEVLHKQPQHIRDLLIETSILNRFCRELIDEVGNPNVEDPSIKGIDNNLIQWLTKYNLFTISLDIEQNWFRYHHLFQDFLFSILKKQRTAQQINELHLKASNWFEKNNFLEEAIYHAIEGSEVESAVRIIKENWEVKSDADDFLTVEKWLSYLPKDVANSSVNLLFARFFNIFKGHKLGELPEVLGLILQSGSEHTDSEKGYLAFVNTMISYYAGTGEKAAAYANEALKFIPEKFTSFRGDVGSYWFISMLMAGKHDQALKTHKKNAKKFLDLNEPVQLGRIRTNIGFYALLNANLPQLITATEDIAKTTNFSNFMLGFYQINLQYICWFNNDMEGVVRQSEFVINLKHEFTSRLVIDSYIMKALALQALDKSSLAREVISEAIKFATFTKDPSNTDVALSGKARLQLAQRNSKDALAWLSSKELAPFDATALWCIEVPAITHCRLLIARGQKEDIEEALNLLIEYKNFSESIFHKVQTIDILVLQALALKILAKDQEALNALKTAIELSADGKWIRPFAEQYVKISGYLLQLKKEGLKPEFIDMITDADRKAKASSKKSLTPQDDLIEQTKREKFTALTQSELKVLECIAQGLRNQEIADKLFNSEETIKKHIYHMFQKLHVKNRLSLVSKAKEEGILV